MLWQIISRAFWASLGIIGQSPTTLVFWGLTVVGAAILVWRRGGLMKDHRKKALETAAIAIAAWVPFFVWQSGYQTKDVEQPEIVKISAPPAPHVENPKVITRTVTSEVEKKCWVSNHVGMPNSTIKGAVTATAAILRCNYKIEAPWQVTLVFDREFIPGALTLPDSGTWFPGGGPGKLGLSYSLQINSPALLSEQLLIVTVYGTTDQFPHALRGSINSLK